MCKNKFLTKTVFTYSHMVKKFLDQDTLNFYFWILDKIEKKIYHNAFDLILYKTLASNIPMNKRAPYYTSYLITCLISPNIYRNPLPISTGVRSRLEIGPLCLLAMDYGKYIF